MSARASRGNEDRENEDRENEEGLTILMTKTHEGILRSGGRKFAIVASRFNDFIGDKLVDGALDAIRRTGDRRRMSRSSVVRARWKSRA